MRLVLFLYNSDIRSCFALKYVIISLASTYKVLKQVSRQSFFFFLIHSPQFDMYHTLKKCTKIKIFLAVAKRISCKR